MTASVRGVSELGNLKGGKKADCTARRSELADELFQRSLPTVADFERSRELRRITRKLRACHPYKITATMITLLLAESCAHGSETHFAKSLRLVWLC